MGGGFDLLEQMIAVVLYQLESLERVNCLCLWSETLNMMHALQGLIPRWVSLRGPVGQLLEIGGSILGLVGQLLGTCGSILGAGGSDCGAGSFFSVGLFKWRWFNKRGHSRGEPLLDFVFVSKTVGGFMIASSEF